MRASRVVALVFGCLLLIPAIAVLVTGGAIAVGYAAGRDDDGYLNVTLDRLETKQPRHARSGQSKPGQSKSGQAKSGQPVRSRRERNRRGPDKQTGRDADRRR